MAFSVAFHVALFLAWPTLSTPRLEGGGYAFGASALELVALGPGAQAPFGFAPVPRSSPAEATPDGADEETGDGGAGGSGDALPAGERRADALRRVASVAPGVLDRSRPLTSESADEEERESADGEGSSGGDGEEENDVRLRPVSSTLDYSRLSEEELLRLERLSALQPELAFGSLSGWLEVQNPTEVVDFMQERFARESEDEPQRTMVVALWVDERGSVEWAEISRSSGRDDFDESALELFRDVVSLRPARERGLNVPTAAIFWLRW